MAQHCTSLHKLFLARADWPILPTQTPAVKIEKAEVPPRVAAIPCAVVLNKPQNNKQMKKMYIGTALPLLQKGRRRYGRLEQ